MGGGAPAGLLRAGLLRGTAPAGVRRAGLRRGCVFIVDRAW